MELPELWVPIPHLFDGFLLQLQDIDLTLDVFETIKGFHRPPVSSFLFRTNEGKEDVRVLGKTGVVMFSLLTRWRSGIAILGRGYSKQVSLFANRF